MLKTGCKEGPSHGKNFYICSVVSDRCSFCSEAPDVIPSIGERHCKTHPGTMVSLRTISTSNSRKETRLYFRCQTGRVDKLPWCGYNVLDEKILFAATGDGDVNATTAPSDCPSSSPRMVKTQRKASEQVGKSGTKKEQTQQSAMSSNKCSAKGSERGDADPKVRSEHRGGEEPNLFEKPQHPNPDQITGDAKMMSIGDTKKAGLGDTKKASFGDTKKASLGDKKKASLGDTKKISLGDSKKTSLGDTKKASLGDTKKTSLGDTKKASLGETKKASLGDTKKASLGDTKKTSLGDTKKTSLGDTTKTSLGDTTKTSLGDEKKVNSRSDTKTVNNSKNVNIGDTKKKNLDVGAKDENNSDSLKGTTPTPMADFASLSLQSRLQDFTLDGNESLLVSPHSGQLKYRSQIRNREDSESDSDSKESFSSAHSRPDTDSDDDCQIIGVESPREAGIKRETARSSSEKSVEAASHKPHQEELQATQQQGPAQATADGAQKPKVLTFASKVELDAYLQEHRGQQVKVVKTQPEVKVLRAELLRNIAEKENLIQRRNQQAELLKRINTKTLPDGGARLQKQVSDLTQQICELDMAIRGGRETMSLQNTLNMQGSRPVAAAAASQSQIVYNIAGQVMAPGTKQTLLTDHIQRLPPHILQQMYADNPQLNHLYGGRMTAARLKEVGSVTSEAIERLHKQLETMPDAEEGMEGPRRLTVPLMPHQKKALPWLMWRELQHPCGGILADDMGLGKTLTMISLILKDKEKRKDGGAEDIDDGWTSKDKHLTKLKKTLKASNATLVVCPASLIHQWHKEIERRCSRHALKVELYHGPNREKDVNVLAKMDVVLTTYNLVSREVGAPPAGTTKAVTDMPVKEDEEEVAASPVAAQPSLLSVAWRRIILDEAHCIKNHKSLTAMSVCRLRAGRRWALTGTPVQNDLLDMYSLMRFLRCSPFDELKVWKHQVDNKSSNGQKRLNTLIKSLLLRRTKDQTNKQGQKLVELPSRECITHNLQLSKEERDIYSRIFQQSKSSLVNYLERAEEKQQMKTGGYGHGHGHDHQDHALTSPSTHPGGAGAGTGQGGSGGGQTGGTQILLMLLRLRQCCSHLHLTKGCLDLEALEKDDGIDLDIVQQMRLMAVDEEVTEEPAATKEKTSIFDPKNPSTKIIQLLEHIEKIREDSDPKKPQKCVVVSQWTQMLGIVEEHLKEAGFRSVIIKGDIPPKKRGDIVEAFNSDPHGPQVMLLSLRAGGVGLNLVGGNHLFLIDMHWNPALEQQACDRIYRMGQTRDVTIHRFICMDTIEEKILQLQKRKLQMADNVLTGAKATANKLTLQDLKMLFGLDRPEPNFMAHPVSFQPATSMWRK